jgi:nitrile hydratase
MNGIHDMGGMDGLGPVIIEPDEPVFHSDWERQVAGLFFATILAGVYNDDEFRQSRERLEPENYLCYSYYHQWLLAIQRLMIEKGIVTEQEISDRMARLAGGRAS